MFDHVTLRVADLEASRRFYATLKTIGIETTHAAQDLVEWDDFSIAPRPPSARPPTTCTSASSRHPTRSWTP